MRRYDAGEVEAALREHGYELFAATAHHRIHAKAGGIVTLPAPDADGTYDADLLDQCIADQWIPIGGRLTARPG